MAARLHCLAHLVRLGDSSFQPSVTCKMRKKNSGSFTSLCAGFVGILEVFGEFMEVCVYLLRFCVSLWRFLCYCGSFVFIYGSFL